ncbi:GFA family protein [Parathermosynechococcus lividus]
MTEMQPIVEEGGCHCGAVRFRVRLQGWQAISCNCSICTKKGFLHYIVSPADFELLQGEDQLTCYRFNTGIARHQFCRTCGIHPFYHPRSHPQDIDVNLNCLDNIHQLRDRFQVQLFDGQQWERSIETLR